MLHYLFPGQKGSFKVEDLYRNIREAARLGNNAGFLYKQDSLTYFRVIPESPDGAIGAAIDEFISFLAESREDELYEPIGDIRFRESKRNIPNDIVESPATIEEAPTSSVPECSSSWKSKLKIRFGIPVKAEVVSLDPRKQALVDAWKRFEREFGVTPEDLDFLFCYSIKLSRLYITKSNGIFLPDWDGEPEVKMDDLTKSLYFFYLRHPEGVAFKELVDHENEVYQIYLSITGRDDLRAIRKTVAGLVSPYSDVRNSCVSRIKKAFKDIVDDRIAKYYYIAGQAGGLRTVGLDRDFVIWEH